MSSKISEMSTETSIQDLPDEILEHILLFLNFYDRRSALQVCRRWSTLKLWSSMQLVVDFRENYGQEANLLRTLLTSSRQYKHLVFCFGLFSGKYELLVKILQHFSSKVETLRIIPFGSVPIEVIAQITVLCSNLRHLDFETCKIEYGPFHSEFSPMNKLEYLYLENDLLSLVPNMMDITPNITRLHMVGNYNSEEAWIFLRHFSLQLVVLKICYLSKDDFLALCRIQFPLLVKLNFEVLDWFRVYETIDAVEIIDLFFQQLPLLKEVTFGCSIDDRVIQNLCRSCVNIQFLCVRIDAFEQDSFRAICELKHLKHLRIEKAVFNAPSDMYSPQTSLRKLTLSSSRCGYVREAEFNSFVQRAFPNLAVMELLDFSDRGLSFDIHKQICSNIPSLQRLVIGEPRSEIKLDQFLEFCASPKELRLKCWKIMDISENKTFKRIPVQKLVLDSPHISLFVLQKLISSMEGLRWLELAQPYYYSPEEISTFQKQFPRCNMVVKRKVVMEEPL